MGSVVLTDVAHHFPRSTHAHGGDAHFSEDALSPSAQCHRVPTPPAPTQSDPPYPHARTPKDSSMSTPRPRAPSSATPTHTQQTWHLAPQTSHLSQRASRPPPSPRFAPREAPPPSLQGTRSQPRTPGDVPSPNSSDQASPAHSFIPSTPGSPHHIKVRSLSHIQSFVADDASLFSRSRHRSLRDAHDAGPQYDISAMPVMDVIEMVAGLLTKITTTNDRQHAHLHRQMPSPDGSTILSSQTTSVLAFHGKNVPTITILMYLTRIHKYCPTTYEVFLSLLIYFDRMTERVNAGPMQTLRQANQQPLEGTTVRSEGSRHSSVSSAPLGRSSSTTSHQAHQDTPPSSGSIGKQSREYGVPGTPHCRPQPPSPNSDESLEVDPYNLAHFFVVDSFNIHRLVIAGVTCASKFFSDVFYTNSRYAKVGGLPLAELNHLELQFLLLNDFRLSAPVEELEAYGTMLVEFYAREVLDQQQHPVGTFDRATDGSSSSATVVAA